MRPSFTLLILFSVFCLVYTGVSFTARGMRGEQDKRFLEMRNVVSSLGLTDLSLSTEARYTRHPAVSDALVIIMDHPGALDHFPSTMFWAPVR
ncbi:MAG: hypothetical protein ACN4GW_03925 [Desulforhopalus sp.]